MANICAQNEQIDVPIESEKSGMRNKSMGNKGTGKESWRRTKKNPTTTRTSSSAPINVSDCPWAKPLNAVISRPNVSAFITALGKSKRGLVSWEMFAGKKRMARINAMIPNGTLIRNSHFHDEMDKIAAAIVGPAAEETATIKELIPMPRPR
ncbi:Uncharacterised protein [Salmonella enterica subsp. enterica serovar Bovismorbificans]|uniref:Uncharacterized protein n=1 Tax=Salmonella enterica subsp. enterica serovar Bovismorbificans TaxID=58097 RepID=A0A655BQS0_SALET|nr:Uncharacterised protein [Salmonella enterica subsp. enterica serovar Bovismorbificans]CNU46641.1 Uncharacterised protein [Salmonella enterica subsp. enterica serovar Bovismorbificans]CPR45794.1 Uncharacterised protein [Salmonella enterica subsp. enterica serovar Bovismorbificans]